MIECIRCGFNDEDYGCTCPHSDRWLELREVSHALNECADRLLMIEIKYDKEQMDNGNVD